MDAAPLCGGGIGSGLESTGEGAADVIDEDVVIFGLSVFGGNDAFEDFGELKNFDREAGFFLDFAEEGGVERFAGFDGSAWEGPDGFVRGLGALDEEDLVVFEDEGTDAEDGARGEAAVVCGVQYWMLPFTSWRRMR